MPTILQIKNEMLDLCDTDITDYGSDAFERRVNGAYELVVAWILEADGRWQWDDTNYSDLPIGTQTLVEGQSKYSFNDKFLEIEEVQVKDDQGDWHILLPIDQKEYSDRLPLSEAFEDSGMPTHYDKLTDDTIELFPAPTSTDVTLASGLKIKYRRTADVFTTAQITAGTKVPGFMSTYHYVLSYMTAIPYCMTYKKDRVPLYEKKVAGYKRDIMKAYSKREQDKRKIMTTKSRPFK